MANQAQERANQALAGFTSALQDITNELQNAQNQIQHWKLEADAWKCRYEQERSRNERLRRVLRCTPQKDSSSSSSSSSTLTAQPSLLKGSSSISPVSPRTYSDSCLQRPQQLHQHSVPLPTLDENRSPDDLRFNSLPSGTHAAAAAGLKPQQGLNLGKAGVGYEGLAPAGDSQEGLGGQRDQGSHAEASMVPRERDPIHWSHDGSIRHHQAAAADDDAGSSDPAAAAAAAAAAEDGLPIQVQRKADSAGTQHLPDPFASYSSQELDAAAAAADHGSSSSSGKMRIAAADPATMHHKPDLEQQLRQQLHPGEQQLQPDHALSGTMSALAPAAAAVAAAAAVNGSEQQPPPFRRASTLPRNWEHFGAAGAGGGGSLAAEAQNFLRSAGSLLPYPGGSSGSSRHTIDQLLRMMMAFTIMQGGTGPGATNESGPDAVEDEPLQSVSLDDDDGSSGVGLAAAAAVSAAMARAWASAASKEQRAVAAAAASGSGGSGDGSGSSQRAGFRLVATVTNKMGKRAPSTAALSSAYSQDSLEGAGSGGSSADLVNLGQQQQQQQQQQHREPSPLSKVTAAVDSSSSSNADPNGSSSPAGKPPIAPQQQQGSSSSMRQPAAATAAANNSTSNASPSSGQATAISLHWLSRPRTVLVMRKLAPSTESAFNKALEWLRRHHITIYVEPKVFQELVDSGRLLPHSSSSGSGSSSHLRKVSGSSNSISGMLADGNGSGTLSGTLITDDTGAAAAAGSSKDGSSSKALIPAPSWPAHGRYSSSSSSNPGMGLVKTWQPEVLIHQQQQQQDGGSSGSSSAKESVLIPEAVAQQLDLVVVLGGDGTVLWTCHIFGNRSVPPLVPFNLGSLGFLTPFDPAKIEAVLHKTLRGGFPITLRHRLHATIVRRASSPCAPSSSIFAPHSGGSSSGDCCMPAVSRNCLGQAIYGEEHVALNEVVIERGISPFLTNLECFCDGGFVTHVQGDGLIIGTPTGSTAYSLAAGGSMVHPQVPCILFTPICPHSLSFRPLMFPDYCQLCIQVPTDSRGHVWASFDGKDRTELVPGDAVVIRLSRWPVPSVAAEADPSGDWFSAVRECLHWNLRKVQGGAGG